MKRISLMMENLLVECIWFYKYETCLESLRIWGEKNPQIKEIYLTHNKISKKYITRQIIVENHKEKNYKILLNYNYGNIDSL